MIAVAETEYESIAARGLNNLKDEIEPREVDLKKTEVDTGDDK
jgi:hypothetical protein